MVKSHIQSQVWGQIRALTQGQVWDQSWNQFNDQKPVQEQQIHNQIRIQIQELT